MLLINFNIQLPKSRYHKGIGQVEPSFKLTHAHRKSQTKMAEKEAIEEAQSKLRSKFIEVIRSRLQHETPLKVLHITPVANPQHQNSPQTKEEIEIMESCPKADIENFEELLHEENMYLYMPDPDVVWYEESLDYWTYRTRIPVLIMKLYEINSQKKPAVVFLHSVHKTKESLRPLLKAYASRGYVAIAMDACHHGDRPKLSNNFRNVYDLIHLADYLTKRDDIDPSRIGITGIGFGGVHAWFAAFADTRYAVVVPLIGVQEFRWIIDSDKWNEQADSMKILFDLVRHNLRKDVVDKEVVEKAWEKIAPGLVSEFDSPYSIPAIAPRPLLIINGAEDPKCPIEGSEVTRSKATEAYEAFQCLDNFKFIAEPGVGHQLTRFQVKESSDWFDRFLKP